MTHTAAWRGRLSRDETDDRLLHVGFDVGRRGFFRVAADFTDHDDGMRLGIVVEQLDGIEERCADNRIAADADTRGLANAEARELIHSFVRERPAAADNANVAGLVNSSRHDADFAFAGRNDARAIRTDEARFITIDRQRNANHIENRNAFGNADDERKRSVGCFENRVSCVWRWNENDRGICARGFCGFCNSVKYGALKMLRAAFARSDTADNVRAVFNHLLRVKRSLAAGKSLHDEARFFVDENAHRAPPASATTFCAPSFMPLAIMKLSPKSRRICWPCSTLVPSIRTTTGTFNWSSFAAATTPVARTSQRRMPPKMLMNTARTAGSLIRMRNAFFT